MHHLSFDTLDYVTKLEEVGVSRQQATVQASAIKQLIEERLATQAHVAHSEERLTFRMKALETQLKRDIAQSEERLKRDIAQSEEKLILKIKELDTRLKRDIAQSEERLKRDIAQSEERVTFKIKELETRLKRDISEMGLKMTIRLGTIMVTSVLVFVAIIKL